MTAAGNNPVEPGVALGRHMTVEFYDCEARTLANARRLETVFLNAAHRSGATVIDSNFHDFEPQGVSGVVVISESHFAVHAWPEFDYAAVDLFTCGDKVDFDCAVKEIAAGIGSRQWIISSMMHRGIVGNNGVERLVPVVEGSDSRYSLSWRNRFDAGPGAQALSAAIDVYECRTELFDDGAATEEFLRRLAGELGVPALSGQFHELPAAAGHHTAELAWKNGRAALDFNRNRRTAYLDVFIGGFFEPRLAAEFAVRELGGSFYRLQPHVRQ